MTDGDGMLPTRNHAARPGSARTIVFRSANLDGICRSNSLGQLLEATTLLLMSMPSANSMARAACSSGRPSSSRYRAEPDGLLSLDPQLVCYSWMTGIADVAQVVLVRKRLVEVQYLLTTITDEQRQK